MIRAFLFHVSIPMKREFSHAKRTRYNAEAVILEIESHGVKGLGECVPRSYVTGESIDSVINKIKNIDIREIVLSIHLGGLDHAIDSLRHLKIYDLPQNVNCLLEMALLDWIGNFFKISISSILKKFVLSSSNVRNDNKILFETSQVLDFSIDVEDFINERGPFHYIKIKVGTDLKNNIEKVAKIRARLGGEVKLSIDANMAWTYDEAFDQITELKKFNIDYYEEPLQSRQWNAYGELKCKTGVNILLDESVCDLADIRAAFSHKACDAINIRISKCGGLINAAEMINFASQNGLSYCIGAQVAEVGPLIAAGRQLVSAVNHSGAFEAGQPDRLFNGDYIISPMPLVDRITNLAIKIDDYGLGCHLNEFIYMFSKETIGLVCDGETL